MEEQKGKKLTKVTANISDFIYPTITIWCIRS